ncbi:MAG: hypothetical protein FGM14_04225 [Flavobacteriales bacterium]|nr:hypothetical protein [Flavobacteriales bacterium]
MSVGSAFLYLNGDFSDVETSNGFVVFFDHVLTSPTHLIFDNYQNPLHTLSITNLFLVFSLIWIFFIGLILAYTVIRLSISRRNSNYEY